MLRQETTPAAAAFAALRAAAEGLGAPCLVQISHTQDAERLLPLIASEHEVVREDGLAGALKRLRRQAFSLVVADFDAGGDLSPAVVLGEHNAAAHLVWLCDAETNRVHEAFVAGVHFVLPRPLPENIALLKAHMRWLSGHLKSRLRGLAVQRIVEEHNALLQREAGGMWAELVALLPNGQEGHARVDVLSASDEPSPWPAHEGDPDALVVLVDGAKSVEDQMAVARKRHHGAALALIDRDASAARMRAALYGGARAYFSATPLAAIAQTVSALALCRRQEIRGRRLVEVLARHGVFEEDHPTTPLSGDLESGRLLAEKEVPVVPSGHEVLVVDDELVVQTVLREALRRGGYRVETASTGEEAIETLKKRQFDLVLTDKNLPGVSGLEVLRFARTLPNAPAVVLITGYSSYDSAAEAMDIGALDYIEKPIRDVEVLRQRVRRALSRRDEQSLRPAEGPAEGAKARVLLVEVEDDKRRLLTEFLSRSFDVVSVASGDEALKTLQDGAFDVVLADRNLPGMSGMRVIEQAQRLLPHCASVLYTAYPSYESVKDAFDVGADAFVVRPSEDLKALETKVAGALAGKGGILLG